MSKSANEIYAFRKPALAKASKKSYNMGVIIMEANRKYKATLFSELFSEPNRLRELYNALADTNYGTETDIEITTLDSAFFNDIRNDLSFIIDGKYTEHGAEVRNMIQGTTFNIDIAREVWQEEAREEAREEFQAEIDAQAAIIEDLKAQLAELQGKE